MVDQAKIIVRAGDGGRGAVSFRREKFIPKGGPDGGDGGKGGNIYFEVDGNLNTLDDFAQRQKFEASDGGHGMGKKMSGAKGEDLVIKVPLGTVVRMKPIEGEEEGVAEIAVKGMPKGRTGNLVVGRNSPEEMLEREIDFDTPGMSLLVAKGGRGGRGNVNFMSSRVTTPMVAERGQKGQGFEVEMNLRLLADIGIVGVPNAGKSTLLSVLSKARPKIANYEFTTLEPNLGVLEIDGRKLILADIPGLIEGASKGKGLGVRFLKHIERTKMLIHLVPVTVDGVRILSPEEMMRNYRLIREELEKYGEEVGRKKEVVILSKIDLVDEKKSEEIIRYFAREEVNVLPISAASRRGIDELISTVRHIR